ncbi:MULTISPECIES: restriction endonuclease [Mesorhizobium]|uniref:Restriction endonuclease n=1 Tax=Mesorhizobium album TaxID=3072314 RepID=A0ABU4Y8S1_9HYPH|nr:MULTISPECIES: restriction endonuclease [unclassified Mesorhizobium]MDX8450859.1 restriction endonuclease [Mesorhizobium sp. VK3C]MDX8483344.1 restriction endonuclease [Mesorhizobium sp. VK24D]
MVTYNFSRLSPYDFEELVGDLLSACWGETLERFTAGRDGGIDLRCFKSGVQTIVQCKHYPGTGFRKLLSTFKREELPRLRKLNPERYVLVTSVGLTPGNKDELRKCAAPYIGSTTDVIGRTELNALLREHPKVEADNFKLWFTSAAVMKRVLHNAERCQTEFEIERVTASLPMFVQSRALPRARSILEGSRIVIISGAPGIGKTTLADMLLYAHLDQGYEPVVIQNSIEEARRLFDRNQKQIFYFDDFLGETFLNDGRVYEKNQDAALVNFMEAVKRTKHSRFILTTREHILRNAVAASERLSSSEILHSRCILELGDYSRRQKARILYNHLFFGDLPAEYKRELLKDDFFLDIVNHKNFTPRLVSWLAGYARVRQVPIEGYRSHVRALLDSPEAIWRYAFEHQISDAARSLLLTLASLGRHVDPLDLRPAWDGIHGHNSRKYNFRTGAHEFRRSIQELEGSFISIGPYGIDFLNPSIRDFMNLLLSGDDDYADDVIAGAIRFRQLQELRDFAVERNAPQLLAKVSSENERYLAALSRTISSQHLRWTKTVVGRQGTLVDLTPEHRLSWLLRWADESRNAKVWQLATSAFQFLQSEQNGVTDINAIIGVLEVLDGAPWARAHGGEGMRRALLDRILECLQFARYYEWDRLLGYAEKSPAWSGPDEAAVSAALVQYRDGGAFDEVSDCSGETELSELKDGLEDLAKKYGLSFYAPLSQINDLLAEFDQLDDERDDRGFGFNGGSSLSELLEFPATDDELRDMFRSLPLI